MEILSSDKKAGIYKLKISSTDDFWHLKHILEKGDLVRAKTTRRTTIKRGSEVTKGDRETIVLTIDVEKIDIDSEVRLSGKIAEGPDSVDKGYHTLRLEIGDDFEIKKIWKKHQLERLEKSRIKKPLLLICVLDRDEASIAGLMESGIKYFLDIKPDLEGDERDPYYKEVAEYLEGKSIEPSQKIVVAGPGFEKENLLEYIKKHKKDLAKKIILEQASYTGQPGIEEVLKRTGNKILTETRISSESKYVDEFLKRIRTGELVSYGKKEVTEAVDFGAVETHLVSVDKIDEFENLMEKTEQAKGQVVLINSDHSAGEQFLKLGGIGCFLRFKIK